VRRHTGKMPCKCGEAMWNRFGLTLLLVSTIGWPGSVNSQSKSPVEDRSKHSSRIVFVCEHGAALSVVAAAYFNKMAKEEHLNMHAVARGTEPQKDVAGSAREGLNADAVPFETKHPRKLSSRDVARARRIVTFCTLPARYSTLASVETWNDVPATAINYGRARDVILQHLRELIRQLRSDDKKR